MPRTLDLAAERPRLQALADAGLTTRQAARRLGLTKDAVKWRARTCGIRFRRGAPGRPPSPKVDIAALRDAVLEQAIEAAAGGCGGCTDELRDAVLAYLRAEGPDELADWIERAAHGR